MTRRTQLGDLLRSYLGLTTLRKWKLSITGDSGSCRELGRGLYSLNLVTHLNLARADQIGPDCAWSNRGRHLAYALQWALALRRWVTVTSSVSERFGKEALGRTGWSGVTGSSTLNRSQIHLSCWGRSSSQRSSDCGWPSGVAPGSRNRFFR